MPNADEDELARWYEHCDPDRELRREWYVPLDEWQDPDTGESLRGGGVADGLERVIRLSRGGQGAAFLMAGFRGTGKTTELSRLKRSLCSPPSGYAVVQFSAADYHHMSDALSKEELGLVIAAGIGEAAADPLAKQSIWDEIREFLASDVELKDVSIKLGSIEIKGVLKSSSEQEFRNQLRKAFSQRPEHFRQFVHGVVNRAVTHFSPGRLVVLVDGLDKYYADIEGLGAVYRTMADRFVQDVDLLRLPGCQVVYVVPPYLAFLHKNVGDRYGGRPFIMPSVKVHGRPPGRAPFLPGMRALSEVLQRRVDLDRIFGHEKASCVSALAEASGGHVRDLLHLMRQVLAECSALPASFADVEHAIRSLSNARGFVFREGVELLTRIAAEGKLSDLSETELGPLAQAFDEQLLLCYQNGESWYDVHPLILRTLPV